MKSIPMLSLLFAFALVIQLNAGNSNPEELGDVSWQRTSVNCRGN